MNAGEGGRATEGEKTQTEAAQEETSRGSQIHLRPALSLLILSQDTSPPIKTGNHRIALHQILVRYHQKRSVSIGRWLSPHSCESLGKNNMTSCDSAQCTVHNRQRGDRRSDRKPFSRQKALGGFSSSSPCLH